jgi:multicomponent Na+:H+ antiporter subunit D
VAGLMYAGGALGVTYAGDLFSLYVFWEIMAIASTFLILARRNEASRASAFRYVMVHIAGGLSLLAGIVLHVKAFDSTAFSYIGLNNAASWFMFVGVAVNAAVFPVHGWLKDAYPEATITGAVFLSAFTTKSAIYVMARMFPGASILIVLGALMCLIPMFYAIIENDIRRVLAYSLINQLGFMLCGIGIGTPLAINGAVAHAFCHILYKSLLFMAAGSVIQMTGKSKCTELGGLYKSMPLTCLFCIIGAASISAVPLFSGFISKSMIITASGQSHLLLSWLAFQFAAISVYVGLKIPYFIFFGKDAGLRPDEAPAHMLIAMGLAALLCVTIGIDFKSLYTMLPFPVRFEPYTASHVVGQLELLLFSALTFFIMLRFNVYPADTDAENLDTDWFYRKGARLFYTVADVSLNSINSICDTVFSKMLPSLIALCATRGPSAVSFGLLSPFKSILGLGSETRPDLKNRIDLAFLTSTIPIGICAGLSTLFIVILFLMK